MNTIIVFTVLAVFAVIYFVSTVKVRKSPDETVRQKFVKIRWIGAAGIIVTALLSVVLK